MMFAILCHMWYCSGKVAKGVVVLDNRDSGISLVRVLAMLSIILCHILAEFDSVRFLGQVFNVGVLTFIFISGYLYGKKDVKHIGSWLYKRGIKILIPMYIFMIFLFIYRAVALDQINIKHYILHLFNVQGFTGGVQGAGHLWFLTVIMLCYLITPLLNNVKNRGFSLKNLVIILAALIVIDIMVTCFISAMIGRFVCFMLLYSVAYFYSFKQQKKTSTKSLILFTAIAIFAVFCRLGAKYLIDGTVLYDSVIVTYSQSIFGAWIFLFIYYFKDKIPTSRLIKHFDDISFAIYITHYMFIVGPFSVMSLTKYAAINIVLVLAFSYVSGFVLNKLSELLLKLLNNGVRKTKTTA